MQTELEIAKLLIPAAAGLVGALGGAALGAALAFRRFRHERAYDRRLDWYERVVRSIHEVLDALGTIEASAVWNREAELPEHEELPEKIRIFVQAAAERDIYGLPAGRDVLARTIQNVTYLMVTNTLENAELMKILAETARVLSEEARREFFPEVGRQYWPSKSRGIAPPPQLGAKHA